ncbi:MAG: hypothetical protein LBR36_09960 [Bacteroidales bacterium]|jgi:CRISPR-associated Csx2 family protein|nr:hypothetical protein [Bacteroidales bacterium]
MARKIFISFLGTGNNNEKYKKGRYKAGDFLSDETEFIQIATLDWIKQKEGVYPDKSFFLLTKSEENSWVALKSELDKKQIEYQPIRDFPKGEDESEIRDIFSKIEKIIEDNDKLYLDLTHDFRDMPIVLLIVSHLATIIKKAKIKHVSYGRALKSKKSTASIVNLLPLVTLLDQTKGITINKAIADYLSHPAGKTKINIFICGDADVKAEILKKYLKTEIQSADCELKITCLLDFNESKKKMMPKIDSNRFDFIISGPVPHSVEGKEIEDNLQSYCTKSGLKAKVYTTYHKPISKAYIKQVGKEILKKITKDKK